MLGSLILGAIAGWAAPSAEPKIKSLLENAKLGDMVDSDLNLRAASLALCLLAAAIFAEIFARAETLPLIIGFVLGVAGPKLHARWKASKAPDYDS